VKAAPALLERAGRMRYLLADKGYDAHHPRRSLRDAGAVRVIPGRRNRKRTIRYDKQRYADRHYIENAFCRLKDYGRVSTAARSSPPTSFQAWRSQQPWPSGSQ
jgi:transposase